VFIEKHFPKSIFGSTKIPPIEFVSHHKSHAASGMYTSGFEDSAVLVVDGRGECQSTSLYRGDQFDLRLLKEWPISESLGNFYGHAADWAGFGFWGARLLGGCGS
jgi:carbamoyltransferase